ncbi:MAG TPA: hypothetical protein VMV78_07545 [Thiobacillus sp.]|jgi:hypothetical protein|nr:hypothetical protein [Thiobacillus sp.]
MQPLSGASIPNWINFYPEAWEAYWPYSSSCFLKLCGVFFSSSDALDSSREQGGEYIVLRPSLPA